MKSRAINFVAAAATATVLAIGAALAHGGATGIVKERMDGMEAMGKALSSVADMFKGITSYNAAEVVNSAEIVGLHAREMKILFPDTPESRESLVSDAMPAIWQDLEDFLSLAERLEFATIQMKTVAQTGSQQDVRAAFAQVAKTCSACHRDYRRPQN